MRFSIWCTALSLAAISHVLIAILFFYEAPVDSLAQPSSGSVVALAAPVRVSLAEYVDPPFTPPTNQPETEPEFEPTPEPVPKPKPKPKPELEPKLTSNPVPEPKIKPKPGPKQKPKKKIQAVKKQPKRSTYEKTVSPSRQTTAAPITPSPAITQPAPSGPARNQSVGNATIPDSALKAYLRQVQRLLLKYKSYPKYAKRRQQEGVVRLKFEITKSGEILHAAIVTSSHYEKLDKAALAILKRVKKFPAIPNDFNRDSLEFTLPIVYKLR